MPKARAAVFLATAFVGIMWAVERQAEYTWVDSRYLYDPATDSVYVIGKTVLLEGLRLRDRVPFARVPKSSVAWVEPWRRTVGQLLTEVATDVATRRPLPTVDTLPGQATQLTGAAWDAAFVEDATISDPSLHLPAALRDRLPPMGDVEFWENVVPVQATVISYTWSSTMRRDSVLVHREAPQSRIIAPGILFRGSAARVLVMEVLQSPPLHRGVRMSEDGERTLLTATGPPR